MHIIALLSFLLWGYERATCFCPGRFRRESHWDARFSNKKWPLKNKHPFLFTGIIAEKCCHFVFSDTVRRTKVLDGKAWVPDMPPMSGTLILAISCLWTSGFCLFHFWVYSVSGTWKNSKWYNSVRIGLAATFRISRSVYFFKTLFILYGNIAN